MQLVPDEPIARAPSFSRTESSQKTDEEISSPECYFKRGESTADFLGRRRIEFIGVLPNSSSKIEKGSGKEVSKPHLQAFKTERALKDAGYDKVDYKTLYKEYNETLLELRKEDDLSRLAEMSGKEVLSDISVEEYSRLANISSRLSDIKEAIKVIIKQDKTQLHGNIHKIFFGSIKQIAKEQMISEAESFLASSPQQILDRQLIVAIRSDNVKMVGDLLAKGADLRAKDTGGLSALQIINLRKNKDVFNKVMEFALEKKIMPLVFQLLLSNWELLNPAFYRGLKELKNNSGENLLNFIVGYDNERMKSNGSINKFDENNNVKLLQNLLTHVFDDKDVKHKADTGKTPLDMIPFNLSIVKLLIEKGADASEKVDKDFTRFDVVIEMERQLAEQQERPMNLDVLLTWHTKNVPITNGIILDFRDGEGNNWLHKAVKDGDKSLIESLSNIGANFNVTNKEGETPLHQAVKDGNKEIVSQLLSYGADLNAKNKEGMTAKGIAVENGLSLIHLILEHEKFDREVLIDNVKKGNFKDYSNYVENIGVDKKSFISNFINTYKDDEGNTLLHYAVTSKNFEMVKSLIDTDADILAFNQEGISPFDMDTTPEIREMLDNKSFELMNYSMSDFAERRFKALVSKTTKQEISLNWIKVEGLSSSDLKKLLSNNEDPRLLQRFVNHNRNRDRYTNIHAPSKNQVLPFLNSNLMTMSNGKTSVISQSPEMFSFLDFWSKFVNGKVDIDTILDLTNVHDRDHRNVKVYYPNEGETLKVGEELRSEAIDLKGQEKSEIIGNSCTVKCIGHKTVDVGYLSGTSANKEKKLEIWTYEVVRYDFDTVKDKEGFEINIPKPPPIKKLIQRYNYTNWPDMGVASLDELEQIFDLIGPGKKIEFMCGAGVGRSGTCLSLQTIKDNLDREIDKFLDNDEIPKNVEQYKSQLSRANSKALMEVDKVILEGREQRGPVFVQRDVQYQILLQFARESCLYKTLQHAIDRRDNEFVSFLLQQKGVSLDFAIRNGDRKVIETILAHKTFKKEEAEKFITNALYQASINSNKLYMVKLLLDAAQSKGIPISSLINQTNVYGQTALHLAEKFNDSELVKYLLDNKADPNMIDSSGKKPLDYSLEERAKKR